MEKYITFCMQIYEGLIYKINKIKFMSCSLTTFTIES